MMKQVVSDLPDDRYRERRVFVRVDFNVPTESLDKDTIAAAITRLIEDDTPVTPRWITDEELAAQRIHKLRLAVPALKFLDHCRFLVVARPVLWCSGDDARKLIARVSGPSRCDSLHRAHRAAPYRRRRVRNRKHAHFP